jgi:hypothetical protein
VRRELERVGHEIADDLLQTDGIRMHPDRFNRDLDDSFDLIARRDDRDARSHALGQIERVPLEYDFSGRDPADVEQIVHEARHVQRLALNDVAGSCGARFLEIREGKHLDGAADGTQRVAKLVREHGEEFVLGLTLALHFRQRADIRDDQRPIFDPVQGHAADRKMSVDQSPAAVEACPKLAGSLENQGVQAHAIGRFHEPIDGRADRVLQRRVHQIRKALVAIDDVAVPVQRGGAFLHLLDQRAVRRIRAAERVHPLARAVHDQERIHFAVADGAQRLLRFGEARPQLCESGRIDVVDWHILVHENQSGYSAGLMSSPSKTRSVLDMSPITRRNGNGNFLISVGAAMICSPSASVGC